jgi:hypothetical protein
LVAWNRKLYIYRLIPGQRHKRANICNYNYKKELMVQNG